MDRKAFGSPIMLLAIISIASVLALGGGAIVRSYNEKAKIDELVERESRLRDGFEIYAQKTQGNFSSFKGGESLVKFMLHEQLLPPQTGDEKKDIAYWLDNGFSKELKVEYTGGSWLNISSEINKVFSKRYYLASGSKNNPSFEEKKYIGHRYMLSKETVMMISKKQTPLVVETKKPFVGQEWGETQPQPPVGSLGLVIEVAKHNEQKWVAGPSKNTTSAW